MIEIGLGYFVGEKVGYFGQVRGEVCCCCGVVCEVVGDLVKNGGEVGLEWVMALVYCVEGSAVYFQ